MGWIYFQELVESESHYRLGSEPFVIANETDMHKAFFCPECDQVTLIRPLFGTMSQHYERSCCLESTSSAEAFHARTSALQGLAEAWTESEAVFSSKLLDSSENADQDSFSLKTSLPSEPVEGRQWLKNWPRSGMTVDGQLYQPQQLAPLTSAKDGFSWPTPTATDHLHNKSEMLENWEKRAKEKKKQGINLQFALRHAVQKWPTPRASEYKDCGPVGSKSQVHMEKRDYLCAKVKEESNPTGMLNPMWVEWLMGYRIGYTELNAWATAWYHSKSARRSKSLQG
jgi:hypothetical protein